MAKIYKGIDFGKGVTCTFTNFQKGYAGFFKKFNLSKEDIKKAFEIASIEVEAKEIKGVKNNRKRKTTDTKKDKK